MQMKHKMTRIVEFYQREKRKQRGKESIACNVAKKLQGVNL